VQCINTTYPWHWAEYLIFSKRFFYCLSADNPFLPWECSSSLLAI
jgi:hypothetical protein